MTGKRIAIVGAGPVGLEAALQARRRGHPFRVYERGRAGESMRQWGHVKMFSPFSMNRSVAGLDLLRSRGESLPDADAALTGAEFAESYLEPLAHVLDGGVQLETEVAGISRARALKGDFIADARRGQRPFRLLLRSGGREWTEEADVVLDCSGTFGNANPLGDGGGWAPGERAQAGDIVYGVPDVTRERARIAGRKVLVVGSGHSAATVIRQLASLQAETPGTQAVWAVRNRRETPCIEVENDPLPARAALAREVNALARDSAWLSWHPGRAVAAIEKSDGGLRVLLDGDEATDDVEVDLILAATGFRPDMALARELQAKLCYATEGTFNLAAALLGETGGDCLAIGSFGVESLMHPEPGYFALGMKSYGRTPDFLIRTGRDQVASVFDWLDAQ